MPFALRIPRIGRKIPSMRAKASSICSKAAFAVPHQAKSRSVPARRDRKVGAGFTFSVERAERALGFLQNLATAILEEAESGGRFGPFI